MEKDLEKRSQEAEEIKTPMEYNLNWIKNIQQQTYKIDINQMRDLNKEPMIYNQPEKYKACLLDNFIAHDKTLSNIVYKLKNWNGEKPVCLLSEKTGCGKTHLAIATARNYFKNVLYKWITDNADKDFGYQDYMMKDFNDYAKSFVPAFYNEADIYYRITSTYSNENNFTEQDVINNYAKRTNLLIIDDMFASRQNDFARGKMYDIINSRITYNGLPTIITSNLTLDKIAEIDERIASRLQGEYTFQLNDVKDMRS